MSEYEQLRDSVRARLPMIRNGIRPPRRRPYRSASTEQTTSQGGQDGNGVIRDKTNRDGISQERGLPYVTSEQKGGGGQETPQICQ